MKTMYVAEDGTQFSDAEACRAYESKPCIYYIENTVDERRTEISRYCSTLEEAKRELEDCCDWCANPGTGRIYAVKLDTGTIPRPTLVYEVNQSDLLFGRR